VRARNALGRGEWSAPARLTLSAAPPAAVGALRLAQPRASSVEVLWDPPADGGAALTAYILSMHVAAPAAPDGGGSAGGEAHGGGGAGSGDWGEPPREDTGGAGSPEVGPLSCEESDPGTPAARAGAPPSDAGGGGGGGGAGLGPAALEATLPPGAARCVAGDLVVGSAYTFRVRAANRAGLGAWSPAAVFRPERARPAPLAAPELSSAAAGVVEVEWDVADDNGAAPPATPRDSVQWDSDP